VLFSVANFFSESETKNEKYVDFRGFFFSFFEIKVIKLAMSRPRHFPGGHLKQHFCKNATAQLGQLPLNAN